MAEFPTAISGRVPDRNLANAQAFYSKKHTG